ncbi:hypothetical protein [Paraburkholderia sp. ZP32-5]|uniref:hypothetical protein n=1 Tax=Paraburkholderia sp. ZP32-5 TaxID=2883245 RepID=UPI001F2E849D|nr:hypothetical protein [Paraburkholderia sp. ZP32-5]
MKLKESSVSIAGDEDNSKTLRLSGALSEWLFATGFWSEVNAVCGTMFDQYEEDMADSGVLNVIQQKIDQRVSELRSAATSTVEFVHGWSADRTPLTATAKTQDFADELIKLQHFLREAVSEDSSAYFSL